MEILIIFGWIIFCVLVAILGHSKSIGGTGAFLISLFFSPLIGFIVVIASSKRAKKTNSEVTKLTNNAIKKYKQKAYKDALGILEKALIIDPNEKLTHFNLASIYSLLKDKNNSFFHLRKATELGYTNYSKISTSEDFKWLREQPEYNALMKNGFKQETIPLKTNNYLDDLKKLAELKTSGIITDAEFETEKDKILKAN